MQAGFLDEADPAMLAADALLQDLQKQEEEEACIVLSCVISACMLPISNVHDIM